MLQKRSVLPDIIADATEFPLSLQITEMLFGIQAALEYFRATQPDLTGDTGGWQRDKQIMANVV